MLGGTGTRRRAIRCGRARHASPLQRITGDACVAPTRFGRSGAVACRSARGPYRPPPSPASLVGVGRARPDGTRVPDPPGPSGPGNRTRSHTILRRWVRHACAPSPPGPLSRTARERGCRAERGGGEGYPTGGACIAPTGCDGRGTEACSSPTGAGPTTAARCRGRASPTQRVRRA